MFQLLHLTLQILILLKIVSLSVEFQYEFEFEDDQIYSKCLDNPNGAKGMEGLFDCSDFTMELNEEGVVISGNLTTVWDVDPTDRVEVRSNTLHWERGFWQPTILNIVIFDFCKVMYDKNQIWFKPVTQHVINVEDVRGKCLTNKETILVFEEYVMMVQLGMGMVVAPGRYRIIIHIVAIDLNNVTRPNGICFEIKGQFFKILK
ncbi:hypothetical protein KR032_001880 [Drosophila birchii]|nr:hypothetical protein KR032_001880 [Drosophila birchii]